MHLRVVRLTWGWLKGFGLTPARFDMMRIVGLYEWGVAQEEVRRRLGVSAPTVSRMLKGLEELGFVVRERMEHDARRRRVHVTRLGLERLRAALAKFIDSRWADRMAEYAFHSRLSASQPRVERLKKVLWHMRQRYGDGAPRHPWMPPAIVPIVQDLVPVLIDGEFEFIPRPA